MVVDDGLGISRLLLFSLIYLFLHLYVGYFVGIERLLFGDLLIYEVGHTK